MKLMTLMVIGIYISVVSLMCLLWRTPIILALCLIIISILMLLKWHTKKDLFYYFVPFILGPVAEIVTIYNGVWKYSKSDFLIPIWLPFGWGLAFLIIIKLSESLIKKR